MMEHETPTFSPDEEPVSTIETELVKPAFYPEEGEAVTVESTEFVEPEFFPEEETGGETAGIGAGELIVPQAFDLDLQPLEAEDLITPDVTIIPQP